eukprot:CAMPEP_0167742742 /NCGR_PEP_ID=MMETSP0110_2-20121227/1610_1 /TAXON_ID=629695 /ORGANISM="Gymnochlora sp., Strain CCMP2014" /LENGTH=79 /DNA_ID=CAMNT_0007626997 /DNA_START=84 /DNA_END=323 /DNA_ORIENTATION=-
MVGLIAVLMRNQHFFKKPGEFSSGVNERNYAATMAFIGNVLFCGSLYGMVLTDVKKLGIITPFGGTCFIVSWVCLAFGK